jgi:aryl-alcohol dehydrogenase-like predicted oxidoreductase
MKKRTMGKGGPELAPLGLGCWAMIKGVYGQAPEDESIATIQRALDLGFALVDTADVYDNGHNEELLGMAIKGRRDQAIISTKVGAVLNTPKFFSDLNGSPEYIKSACEGSLKRLGIDVIDIYTLHRTDPKVPIEETVGGMADLVKAGKVRYLALSEVSSDQLRRAHAIHPITVLQNEYSLFSRDPENNMLETIRELGVAFVAFAPLGRGQLTGRVKSTADLDDEDRRKVFPRFNEENIRRNAALVETLEGIAAEKGCTTPQLALAWLLHQGDDIFPIPGAEKREYVEQNIAACDVALSDTDLEQIDAVVPQGAAAGDRMPEGEPTLATSSD